jgi:hypothetical protein
MKRRSAVPLAIENMNRMVPTRIQKKRKLKTSAVDAETGYILSRLAENRDRIERLEADIWQCSEVDCSEIVDELELLRANVELGLIDIAGGLEEIPSSEEILAEAFV